MMEEFWLGKVCLKVDSLNIPDGSLKVDPVFCVMWRTVWPE